MDGFWILRCLKKRIALPDKIGSFLSGATTPMVVKNGTKNIIPIPMLKLSISQPFEELQGWNLELKLITPISSTGSHFGTMAAILDFFKMCIVRLPATMEIGLKLWDNLFETELRKVLILVNPRLAKCNISWP